MSRIILFFGQIEVDWRPLFDEVVALTYGESLLDIHAASLSFTVRTAYVVIFLGFCRY